MLDSNIISNMTCDYRSDNCVLYKKVTDYSREINELMNDKRWNDVNIVTNHCDNNNIPFKISYREHFEKAIKDNNMESAIIIFNMTNEHGIIHQEDFRIVCNNDNIEFAKWLFENSDISLDVHDELNNGCINNGLKIVTWLDNMIINNNYVDNFRNAIIYNNIEVSKYLYRKYGKKVIYDAGNILRDSFRSNNNELIKYVINIIADDIAKNNDIFFKIICMNCCLEIVNFFYDNINFDTDIGIIMKDDIVFNVMDHSLTFFETICCYNINVAKFLFEKMNDDIKRSFINKHSAKIISIFFLDQKIEFDVMLFIYNNKYQNNKKKIRRIINKEGSNKYRFKLAHCNLKRMIKLLEFCQIEKMSINCTYICDEILDREYSKLSDDENAIITLIQNNWNLFVNYKCSIFNF